jgi:hypothetical protein
MTCDPATCTQCAEAEYLAPLREPVFDHCTPETHYWVFVTRDFDVCRDCRQSRAVLR